MSFGIASVAAITIIAFLAGQIVKNIQEQRVCHES